ATCQAGVCSCTMPEDSGVVPPDRRTAICENTVARRLMTLMGCFTNCQTQQARGRTSDEEACEQGAGRPLSCRAAYDRASNALLNRATPICPGCLYATAQNNLADVVTDFLERNNGLLYCAGTTPLGDDDPGFVPPDQKTAACEATVAKHLAKLASCITG